ncbi:MAG: DUF6062 family protein [Clostridia bacterium]|nr:DUF6062 family protein [Clostridia bacterium]
MQERIYSIPLTDALNEDCDCVMCRVAKTIEDSNIEYFLGPSMMEPECRMVTNNRGFCPRHLTKLYEWGNRLSLALMLDTHIEEMRGRLKRRTKHFKVSGIGSGGAKKSVEKLTDELDKIVSSCAVCDKMNKEVRAAAGNLVYLWDQESEFRRKFAESKGLCMPHMKLVLEESANELTGRKLEEFVRELCNLQSSRLDELNEDVHWFTQKYDYRNQDAPWGNAKDALPRAVKRLGGE